MGRIMKSYLILFNKTGLKVKPALCGLKSVLGWIRMSLELLLLSWSLLF